MGVPKKEMIDITTLVDEILTGNYSLYKKVTESDNIIDTILDEISNKIDNVPDQNLPALRQTVKDELTKSSISLSKEDIKFYKENSNIAEWKELALLIHEKCKSHKKESQNECLLVAAKEAIKHRVQQMKESKLPSIQEADNKIDLILGTMNSNKK